MITMEGRTYMAEKKEKEKPGSRVKTLIQSQEKEPVAEGTDWGDALGFDEII